MLLAILQHNSLHFSQQSVINFYSEWVNFLADGDYLSTKYRER